MSEMPAKKRLGRPPKGPPPKAPARSTFSVRLRGEVRAALLKAIEASGRSISEEVEARLEQSLEADRAFGDPVTQALMIAVAQRLRNYERRFKQNWLQIEDPRFHQSAGRVLEQLIALFQADLEFRPITVAEAERIAAEPAMNLSGLDQPLPPGEWKTEDDHDLPPDPARDAPLSSTRALRPKEGDKSDVAPKDVDDRPPRALDV